MKRTAYTARAVGIILAAASAWLVNVAWPFAVVAVYVAAVCLWVDRSYTRLDRRERARAQRPAEDDGRVEVPVPCCSFWANSDGQVHGPDCTRPVLPRRDTYRLDDAGRAAFEEITAHFDDRSAA
ncbi:hypothetical protein ABZ330_00265 [Streptomyces sp. NPDC006172]|uniref:hypothetical protein n=1 Tax=Streptomyces sp. NPDC006172 TaxID=3154470 RepID=UPI0033D09AD3